MSNRPILITGATGKTGRRVAALLEKRGIAVRSVSRKSEIRFDWDDPSTWSVALQGVRAVYIVHPGLGMDGAAGQVKQFAQAAAGAGVDKAVLISTPDDGSDFSRSMREAEQHIVDAGLHLTSLRLRWFFQNFSEDFLLQSVLSGELRLPAGEGKEAFVDADDIAEVAVTALTDARHNGRIYDLTGPRLLSFADVAREITIGAGVPLRYVPLDVETYVAEQLAQQVPEGWAYTLASLYQDIARGKLGIVSADIERVLGRPANDFSKFVSNIADEGTWNTSAK